MRLAIHSYGCCANSGKSGQRMIVVGTVFVVDQWTTAMPLSRQGATVDGECHIVHAVSSLVVVVVVIVVVVV